MKKSLLILMFAASSLMLLAQNLPVAVDDSATAVLGQYITVDVTANDYHPDSLSFKIFVALGAYSFTDSTITYYIEYEHFYNFYGVLKLRYVIKDENGLFGEESVGWVHINVDNGYYFDTLDINNIRTTIFAYGNHFWNGPSELEQLNMYEFPKGSGKHTMFNTSLWIGGVDQDDQLRLAAERYRQVGLDYWTGPLSTDGTASIDSATNLAWHRVWKIDKEDIFYHLDHWQDPGYDPIYNIANWPAHGDVALQQSKYLAPFVDVDGDSLYDPLSGDYPLIRGDQCIFFIFNDQRLHGESQSTGSLGIEIHGTAYQFDRPDNDPMNNTVFISYKIFNRSNNTLNDTYIGVFSDMDVGYPWDDFVGCDVARGAYYGYNGDDFDDIDTVGYGDQPPAQGIIILGGPYMDPNGTDDPAGGCDESINGVGFGDDVIDNERYGMKKFMYFVNCGAAPWCDPQTADEYYSFMQGVWKDGTVMEYGGNGHISTGAYGPACNFMFPGLSDECFWGTGGEEPYGPVDWTEESAGNDPGDKRGLSAMGPFTFEPGSVEKIDLAFVTAQGADYLASVDLLKTYIDSVKAEYYKNSDNFGYPYLSIGETERPTNRLLVYPNPVNTRLRIVYEGGDRNVDYFVRDVYGRLVKSGHVNSEEAFSISVRDLENGIYIVSVQDKKQVFTAKVIKR